MEWLASYIPGRAFTFAWSVSIGEQEESPDTPYLEQLGKEIGPEAVLLTTTLVLLKYFAAVQLEELEKRCPISIIHYGLRMYWMLMILAIYIFMVHKANNEPLLYFSLVACAGILLMCASVFIVESYKSYFKCKVIPEKSKIKRIERFQRAVMKFFRGLRVRRKSAEKKEGVARKNGVGNVMEKDYKKKEVRRKENVKVEGKMKK